MTDHPADDYTRDIPPDVLSMGDRARMRIEELLGGAPVTLVTLAYRRGRDDAAGGPPDMSEASLRLTAKAVHNARPGVSVPSAYAVIQALLVLGWRPPPAAPDPFEHPTGAPCSDPWCEDKANPGPACEGPWTCTGINVCDRTDCDRARLAAENTEAS